MDANDHACYLNDRIARIFFANRLAPAGGALVFKGKKKSLKAL
ncbi:hypothetical protein PS659_05594 [Pseudomonas fluorescens]|uniref:Uncharacterized protein n=1 Tax=Pseudomonas fluorescens TaxID=294 RepID=A0A5E6XP98_PSEFL|nr:hypothetical protein PS659_05594 [Pseudomonas fluorescens]